MAPYESCLDAQEAVVTSMTGMAATEELYNQGFISYPTTQTERFRPEIDHMSLIRSFQGAAGEL
eukprot:2774622-Ditylum_brightwellii.AAC.1